MDVKLFNRLSKISLQRQQLQDSTEFDQSDPEGDTVSDGKSEKPEPDVACDGIAPDTECFVLKLPGDVLQSLLNTTSGQRASILLQWQHRLPRDTMICLMEIGQQGKILGRASLYDIGNIQTFSSLRALSEFKTATDLQKQAWRRRVVQDKKPIFRWVFADFLKYELPLQVNSFRGKTMWTTMGQLQPHVATDLPSPDLQQTCEYFVQRLSKTKKTLLRTRLAALDGCTVSIGSTCSGTDICVSIMQCTMAALNKMFNVAWITR